LLRGCERRDGRPRCFYLRLLCVMRKQEHSSLRVATEEEGAILKEESRAHFRMAVSNEKMNNPSMSVSHECHK
jgi:hypothetical protein